MDDDGDLRTRTDIVGGRPLNKNHPTKRVAFDSLNRTLRTSKHSDPSPAHRTVKAGPFRNQCVHILKGPKLASLSKPDAKQYIKDPKPREDSSRYQSKGKRFDFPNMRVLTTEEENERKHDGDDDDGTESRLPRWHEDSFTGMVEKDGEHRYVRYAKTQGPEDPNKVGIPYVLKSLRPSKSAHLKQEAFPGQMCKQCLVRCAVWQSRCRVG